MNIENEIYKPDPALFTDKKFYDRVCLMYQRCGVTQKMINNPQHVPEPEPEPYTPQLHAVCTDFVNNVWEYVNY